MTGIGTSDMGATPKPLIYRMSGMSVFEVYANFDNVTLLEYKT
jgi:hypothetical protein